MRRKKHKHTRRAVKFYKIHHGFREPYKVLSAFHLPLKQQVMDVQLECCLAGGFGQQLCACLAASKVSLHKLHAIA